MEDEFYNLVVQGNDLKTCIKRFQELAVLCPNMVPNTEKLMEAFIGGLPQSIERNITASKPQTLEEAITITQRLMEQVIKHSSAQDTNNHKRKFEDRRNTTKTTTIPINTTTITTPTIAITTTTKITATIRTVTMITTNRIEDKKPSVLMLPPMGILGIIPCVKGAPPSHRTLHCQVNSRHFSRNRWRYGYAQSVPMERGDTFRKTGKAKPASHGTFNVSNLKKCLSDETLAILLDEIQIDDKLHSIEEPVEIMDREVKHLKQNRIPIVKVQWNSRTGHEFTWEREDHFRKKCPHLFSDPITAPTATLETLQKSVMPLSVILISFDSSEESVGLSTSRVIQFGMIPAVIPTDVSTIVPASSEMAAAIVTSSVGVLDLDTHSTSETDPFEDPSSLVHAPVAPITSPFLFTDSFEPSRDFFDSDSSEIPPSPDSHEVVVARWRSKAAARSSSSSSSAFTPPAPRQTVPALPDLPRRHAILVLSGQEIPFGRPYHTQPNGACMLLTARKRVHPFHARIPANRRRSPTVDSLFIRADLLPPHKRLRDPSSAYYHEVSVEVSNEIDIEDSIETGAEGDIERDIEDSYEVDTESDIDSDIQADIVEAAAAIEADTTTDVVAPVEADVKPVKAESEPVEAEADAETRLECWRGVTLDFEMRWELRERERIASVERRLGYVSEELRRIQLTHQTMTITRTGMTHEAIEELINQCVAEALADQEANRNVGPVVESENQYGDKEGDINGRGNGNGNSGGNGNSNGGGNGNHGNGNRNRINGVVGLARWFEKMESMYRISNCPMDSQVKFTTCTLLDSALTWWNSHVQTTRIDEAYEMSWKDLMKLMIKVYCPKNEIHKMVPEEEDKIERYIWGLLDNIQGSVNSSKPTRLQDAIKMANSLMD
ncbi:hypothetical protein Tco_0322161 [Tanacetum coccineum]